MINFNHLRVFNAVMKEQSFSKAAKYLGVSQPAVTTQISRLEREYNIFLFERGGSGAIATTIAERLYAISKDVSTIETRLSEFLHQDRNREVSELRITTASPQVFMPLISAFKKRHPQVQLNVHVAGTLEALDILLNRDADIGLLPIEKKDNRLHSFPFARQELKLMVCKSHPLASRDKVSLREVVQYPLIFRTSTSYTQRATDEAMKSCNLEELSPSYVFSNREAVMEAVANDLGVGFTLKYDFTDAHRIQLIDIEEDVDGLWESVAWLNSRSNVAGVQAFVRLAEEKHIPY